MGDTIRNKHPSKSVAVSDDGKYLVTTDENQRRERPPRSERRIRRSDRIICAGAAIRRGRCRFIAVVGIVQIDGLIGLLAA